MKCRLLIAIMLFLSAAVLLQAQGAKCPDAAEDSHFSVLFENNHVRVLSLDLGRIESTGSFSYKRPHMNVITTESRTVAAAQGAGGVTTEWARGQVEFVYNVPCQTVRNDTSIAHRQIIVETYLPVDYNPLQEREAILDLSTVKPTTSISIMRGHLTATRYQIAPGDSSDTNGGDHVLVALTDLELKADDGTVISLTNQEAKVITGKKISRLTNEGSKPARFVIIDF